MEHRQLAKLERRHPAWELALVYPDQGSWSEADYFELDVGRAVEFSDGYLEFQPMPDERHQAIVLEVVDALRAFGGGKTIMAPFPVRVAPSKFREPDVAYMKDEHGDRRKGTHWEGADVVMEVVSESNRKRDTETKRREYAEAGIPEYWIIDPGRERVTVLALAGDGYEVAGEHRPGDRAPSSYLPGFELEVQALLAAE